MNKIGRIIALFFAAISVTVAIPLSTSAAQVSIDVTTDNLEVKFYTADSNFTRFTGSTYIQRYSSDYAGVHYSQVFNRKFNNFFSSSSGKQPSDFTCWSLHQYLTVDNALINLDSDYIELAYYVAFSDMSDLKSASLIFDDPTKPGIELGSDFYTVERVKGDGTHLNGYPYYYRLKFYFKTERVFDYFDSLNPVIKNFDFYIEFSNVDVDYIFFSDIYFSTNSDQAVLDAIANCSGEICGKLDNVTQVLSGAIDASSDRISNTMMNVKDYIMDVGADKINNLQNGMSEDFADWVANVKESEANLDVYTQINYSVDIQDCLDHFNTDGFVFVSGLMSNIYTAVPILVYLTIFTMSLGLITFALGRRVR